MAQQQHVLEVGDVVAVWPGENDSLFWLTICRDNVKQGYNPQSCNIQTFFLRFSGERQRGHMVFVEESDDKVFGSISLESIICKSIELLPGDNVGQGFSFLLPPEEEARIADAIRVWEEQGEDLRHIKEEPVDLDTLPDTQGGAQDTPPSQQQHPQQKQTRLYTVSKIIGQRENEEGEREYLLDWAESWEYKSGVFQRPKGRVKKTKPRPEKAVGKAGGDKVEGLGTINEEIERIVEVEPSGLGRCYKVRWTPTWTSELECPVTYILRWRIEQKQKQQVEQQEVKEEEEIEDSEDSEEDRGELYSTHKLTVAKRPSMMLTQAMPSADHTPGPSQTQLTPTDRAGVPAGKTPAAATTATRPVLAGKTPAASRSTPRTWREIIRLSLVELGQASVAQLDAYIQAHFPEKRGKQNSKATIRRTLHIIGQCCRQAGREQEWRLRAVEEDEEEEDEEEEDEGEEGVDVNKLRELYATSRRPSVEDLQNQFIQAKCDEDIHKKQEALRELEDSLRHDLEEEGATELLYRKDAAPPPPPVERRIVLVVWYDGIKYLAQYPCPATVGEVKIKTLRMAGRTGCINRYYYSLFIRPVYPEDTEDEPAELEDVELDEDYNYREFWLFEGMELPALPWPHWPGF